MVEDNRNTNMDPGEQNEIEDELPEGYELPDGWEDDTFYIDDTPENIAKALFNVRPGDEKFQQAYLKGLKKKETTE